MHAFIYEGIVLWARSTCALLDMWLSRWAMAEAPHQWASYLIQSTVEVQRHGGVVLRCPAQGFSPRIPPSNLAPALSHIRCANPETWHWRIFVALLHVQTGPPLFWKRGPTQSDHETSWRLSNGNLWERLFALKQFIFCLTAHRGWPLFMHISKACDEYTVCVGD